MTKKNRSVGMQKREKKKEKRKKKFLAKEIKGSPAVSTRVGNLLIKQEIVIWSDLVKKTKQEIAEMRGISQITVDIFNLILKSKGLKYRKQTKAEKKAAKNAA